jgi:heme exporter protein A
VRKFGSRRAVDRVSLSIDAGESVALFGPNGAGKTTLLRLMTASLRMSSGSIRIDGLDWRRDARRIRSRIGVISHASFLYEDLSAIDNLTFFARLHGVEDSRAAARRWLETMELEDRADDPPKAFSRGMTQRLSLARSLVHEPSLVFLDEPFSGLDPHAATMLRSTLDRLRKDGRTLVTVTHDIPLGLEISDRWILLRGGRIVEEGASAGVDGAEFGSTRFLSAARRGGVTS